MKVFKRYFAIPAPPEEVYLALTNPLTIYLWTGEEAEMSSEPGSEFSLWGGNICGKNLEFEESKKIVQEWYFGDRPEQSIVTLKLHKTDNGQTSVELHQTNIPDEDFQNIQDGWTGMYFGALREFYEE
jgi:activator of HSP90 ATPase